MPAVSIGTITSLMPLWGGPVGVGAADQVAVVGQLAEARPDLLAVDHEVVAVAHGAGGERGEVGPGVRFGHADAPRGLARQDSGRNSACWSAVP
jgi:hypothetical protein